MRESLFKTSTFLLRREKCFFQYVHPQRRLGNQPRFRWGLRSWYSLPLRAFSSILCGDFGTKLWPGFLTYPENTRGAPFLAQRGTSFAQRFFPEQISGVRWMSAWCVFSSHGYRHHCNVHSGELRKTGKKDPFISHTALTGKYKAMTL